MNQQPALIFTILCDKVDAEQGKYSFSGLFDIIGTKKFPAVHKNIHVVTRWGCGLGSNFKQRVLISYADTSEPIFDSAKFEKPFTLADVKATHTIIGHIPEFPLKREADCKIEVFLDGKRQDAQIFFKIAQVDTASISRNRLAGILSA